MTACVQCNVHNAGTQRGPSTVAYVYSDGICWPFVALLYRGYMSCLCMYCCCIYFLLSVSMCCEGLGFVAYMFPLSIRDGVAFVFGLHMFPVSIRDGVVFVFSLHTCSRCHVQCWSVCVCAAHMFPVSIRDGVAFVFGLHTCSRCHVQCWSVRVCAAHMFALPYAMLGFLCVCFIYAMRCVYNIHDNIQLSNKYRSIPNLL